MAGRRTALHHVELCVRDGPSTVAYFSQRLHFSVWARRDTPAARQWVVRSRRSVFVVTQKRETDEYQPCPNEAWPFLTFCCRGRHQIDSVFNVALEVDDVDRVAEKMHRQGGRVYQAPTSTSPERDAAGAVRYAVVGSCCGNVVHTLLDKRRYTGAFLPTFDAVADSIHVAGDELVTHVDHLTYVCRPGQSPAVLRWYEACLGARRFSASIADDPIEGLVIGDGIGMRLRVLDYWRCAETGLVLDDADANDGSSLKIVLVESLPHQENSHIGAFLKGHDGPGLQHIGLHTDDIVDTVRTLSDSGVPFRRPPDAYYDLEAKMEQIARSGRDALRFRQLGILIDPEADAAAADDDDAGERYLLQIFTLPVFREETFFFEVLQRQGARGFGSGNVTALAKSIQQQVERTRLAEAKAEAEAAAAASSVSTPATVVAAVAAVSAAESSSSSRPAQRS